MLYKAPNQKMSVKCQFTGARAWRQSNFRHTTFLFLVAGWCGVSSSRLQMRQSDLSQCFTIDGPLTANAGSLESLFWERVGDYYATEGDREHFMHVPA